MSSSSLHRADKEAEDRLRASRSAFVHDDGASMRHSPSNTPAEIPPPSPSIGVPVYIEGPSSSHSSGGGTRAPAAGAPTWRDRNRRHASWLLHAISAVQVGLFIVAMYLSDWGMVDLYDNPLMGPGLAPLLQIG